MYSETYYPRIHLGWNELHSLVDERWHLIDGPRPVVLKISNAAEDPAQLDFEALAAQRVALVDAELPVALPLPVPGTTNGPDDPRAYRAEEVGQRTGE